MIIKAKDLIKELVSKTDPQRAKILQWFFKTGPGQYGEGDIFLGLYVPQVKGTIREYISLSLSEVTKLLDSKYHEVRFAAGQILVQKYKKSLEKEKKEIFNFVIKNIEKLNNWDLVDCTVPNIVGAFLFDKNRQPLYVLAKSKNLWRRRTAMVSTYFLIKQGDLKETFKLAGILIGDKEELIHKAVGWMLREAGKKDEIALTRFLEENYSLLSRVTLRYAIEKFPPMQRKMFLKGLFNVPSRDY